MAKNPVSRREFLKTCMAASAAAVGGFVSKNASASPGIINSDFAYDAKGLPTRILGRTGVSVPVIGLEAEAAFVGSGTSTKALSF